MSGAENTVDMDSGEYLANRWKMFVDAIEATAAAESFTVLWMETPTPLTNEVKYVSASFKPKLLGKSGHSDAQS